MSSSAELGTAVSLPGQPWRVVTCSDFVQRPAHPVPHSQCYLISSLLSASRCQYKTSLVHGGGLQKTRNAQSAGESTRRVATLWRLCRGCIGHGPLEDVIFPICMFSWPKIDPRIPNNAQPMQVGSDAWEGSSPNEYFRDPSRMYEESCIGMERMFMLGADQSQKHEASHESIDCQLHLHAKAAAKFSVLLQELYSTTEYLIQPNQADLLPT